MDNMSILDQIKSLCKEHDMTVSVLESNLHLPKNTIYQWRTRTPGVDRLVEIADYFNVSIDYLLGRHFNKSNNLVEKNEYDIQLTLKSIISDLESKNGLTSYNGEMLGELEEADSELLIISLEQSLRILKRIT